MNNASTRWLLLGTDPRFISIQQLLEEDGCSAIVYEDLTQSEKLFSRLEKFIPHHIVFPFQQLDYQIPSSLFIDGAQLYVGQCDDAWLHPLKKAKLTIHRFLQEELFLWKNAQLTAEAFVAYSHQEKQSSIQSKKYVIAGFGRLGKSLAKILYAMGAEVSIITANEREYAEAHMTSYCTFHLTEYRSSRDEILLNTIPSQWFEETIGKPSHIFDLASFPGCLKENCTVEYYTLLPGLPGKQFPTTAAKLLYGVLTRLGEKGERK